MVHYEIILNTKAVSLGETTLGKLLIFLLHAWVRVQIMFFLIISSIRKALGW
jgi:hypothetical protein